MSKTINGNTTCLKCDHQCCSYDFGFIGLWSKDNPALLSKLSRKLYQWVQANIKYRAKFRDFIYKHSNHCLMLHKKRCLLHHTPFKPDVCKEYTCNKFPD